MNRPFMIRKNPIIIVYSFLALQLTIGAMYVLAGYVAHYASIYRSLGFDHVISFQIAQVVFIFSIETLLLFFIFFRWHRETITLRSDAIVCSKGVLFRSMQMVPFDSISSAEFKQGPLGRLVKFGTVILDNHQAGRVTKFRFISEPQEMVGILSAKRGSVPDFKTPLDLQIFRAVEKGEHENLEFKSTFRWDIKASKVNKHLERSVMKTIVGFLNAQGGRLLLGIDDRGKILGLADDYATLGKPNSDGFENHFSHVFNSMIGAEFRQLTKTTWANLKERDIFIIDVSPSAKPAYLRHEDGEEFYIRTGNGTTALTVSEAHSYIKTRFSEVQSA